MENFTLRTAQIAAQNDVFRRTFTGGEVYLTAGVRALADQGSLIPLYKLVQQDEPEPGNDSYGERDFGAIIFRGTKVFWKMDYFDTALKYRSPDPADPAVTRRVLTIMRADEY